MREWHSPVGAFQMPYAELIQMIGKPNGVDDGYKVDAEWILNHNGDVATIYNWKMTKTTLVAEPSRI